jgi:hypothetical protein
MPVVSIPDPRFAGTILNTPVIFMALLSMFAGYLSDRRDPGVVIGAGLVSYSPGLLLLTRLDNGTRPLVIITLPSQVWVSLSPSHRWSGTA